VLYTSSGDQKRRYFDQEQGEELCLYRVDLGTYPNFLEQVEASLFGGFYVGGCEYRSRVVGMINLYSRHIDFVLGFEMDSAGGIMITYLRYKCYRTDMVFDWGIEIRCALLYKGVKCGSVTCHPRKYRTPPL
jgi:hypothetical protein